MNGTDGVLAGVEDLVSEEEATPPEERDLQEELTQKAGIIWPVDIPLTQYMQLVDISDKIDDIVYVTVGFVPPPTPQGREPLGQGRFTMTFRVLKGEVRLVDWLGE